MAPVRRSLWESGRRIQLSELHSLQGGVLPSGDPILEEFFPAESTGVGQTLFLKQAPPATLEPLIPPVGAGRCCSSKPGAQQGKGTGGSHSRGGHVRQQLGWGQAGDLRGWDCACSMCKRLLCRGQIHLRILWETTQ